jgi:hypothetical protein
MLIVRIGRTRQIPQYFLSLASMLRSYRRDVNKVLASFAAGGDCPSMRRLK